MSNTICFFGATGGVANACLTAALKSGQYKAIALARTPEKLKKQLITQQGLEESLIDEKLTIVKGNALELADVKNAILANFIAKVDQALPSMIVTSVGGSPKLTFNFWRPLQCVTLDNPVICETAAKTVLGALRAISADQPLLSATKPAVMFVSTTGVSRGPEDVPFWMRFLYHQILTIAHEDKRKMEDTFRDHMAEPQPLLSTVTGIRPTLLMGTGALNESIGFEKLRAGVESKPELGFTVQRADVGIWMFEKVIKEVDGGKWRSEMVSLTS